LKIQIFFSFTVWADNADGVSLIYSGTGALKTDFTRFSFSFFVSFLNSLFYFYFIFFFGKKELENEQFKEQCKMVLILLSDMFKITFWMDIAKFYLFYFLIFFFELKISFFLFNKKDAFDLFLGNYQIRKGTHSPFLSFENTDNSVRRKLVFFFFFFFFKSEIKFLMVLNFFFLLYSYHHYSSLLSLC